MIDKIAVLLWALVPAWLAGCAPAAAPTYAAQRVALPLFPGDASPGQIQAAIVRAGAGLGWKMRQVGPEDLRGTQHAHGHRLSVRIRFGLDTYQILYPATGTGPQDWPPTRDVRNLSQQIQMEVACLTRLPCQRRA